MLLLFGCIQLLVQSTLPPVTGDVCKKTQYIRQPALDGQFGSTQKGDLFTADSVIQCADLCRQAGPACLSFFYAGNERKCQLHNVIFGVKVGTTALSQARYYVDEKYTSVCPDGWQMHGTSCYFSILEDKDIFSAETHCNSLKNDSYLVEINSNMEQGLLIFLYISLPTTAFWLPMINGTRNVWSGSQTPVTYTNWGLGTSFTTNQCHVMLKPSGLKWVDHDCAKHASFICEYRFIN